MARNHLFDWRSHLQRLPPDVALRLPQGLQIGPANPRVTLAFSSWSGVARLRKGQIGALAEDYVEGKLQLHGAMRDVMRVACRLLPGNPAHHGAGWLARLSQQARSFASHTPTTDAAKIEFHYDVSDAFYALWLDPRRVYSCAYYNDLADPGITLAHAQQAKLDLICRKLMLKPGERFLYVGVGWGGLLLWAAEHYGARATGITLSKNQHAHVRRLIAQKNLDQRVQISLCDYRSLTDDAHFDKIASVGMFEHVGQERLTGYFEKNRRLLAPGGLVLNHGITAGGLRNAQLGAGIGEFIGKYIFPGGELVHASVALRHLAEAGLEMVDAENLRPHYARTLWDWSDALEAQLGQAREVLAAESSPTQAERVLRAYRLYLAGSAMSFDEGWIALHQFLATRGRESTGTQPDLATRRARAAYPCNRSYMYR